MIIHAGSILTPCGSSLKHGSQMSEISLMKDSYIVEENGTIIDITNNYRGRPDLEARLVTPGLVDAHTHIPFFGERSDEFILRASGKSYLDIHEKGLGIYSTVKSVGNSSDDELDTYNLKYLDKFISNGIVAIECKSGYGLSNSGEFKQLECMKRLDRKSKIRIIKTYMPMHALPSDMSESDFVEEAVASLEKVRSLAEYVDVFCDRGVFSVDQCRKFLESAKTKGFKLRLHADEIENIGATRLGIELGATSVDHLLKTSDEEKKLLAKSGTVAVLLPSTSFYLNEPYADARKIIDYGGSVALGSDFNPGSSPIFNPNFIMNLAINKLKMSWKEVLTAYTLNSACVLGLQDKFGSIEKGKDCTIVAWKSDKFCSLPYMWILY